MSPIHLNITEEVGDKGRGAKVRLSILLCVYILVY